MPLADAVPPTSICFPKGIACSASAACPAGWSCLDFAAVKEKDLAEMWTATGATKFCWPDVLAGVPNKTTRVDSTKTGVTAVRGGGSDGPTIGLGPTSDGGMATVDEAPVATASDGGTVRGSDKDSGCTMLGRGSNAGLWLCLGLALAWRLGRKRR
jgi:hypothetical protein